MSSSSYDRGALEYLIWSHQHAGWWGPDGSGYTSHFSQAKRFTHIDALVNCAEAMPAATRLGALPDLPVRRHDLIAMMGHYWVENIRIEEPWL